MWRGVEGPRRKVAGLTILAVSFVPLACGEEAPAIDEADQSRVIALAEPAADELLRTLVAHLTEAMEEGGPVNAIEFCSEEAIPLTRTVQAGLGPGFELKRTSFRYRNPANAPDEAEELALRYFEDAGLSGDPVPSSYVQRVSAEEFRYYRPLYLGPVCVTCHGAREEIQPQVIEALDSRYPGDLAVGYAPGDFRGVVRISVPASAMEGESGS
jgi:hypothetical protein